MKKIKDLLPNKKKQQSIPPIPTIEEIAEELYNKSLSFEDYEVVKVLYNKDKTKRFILLKSSNGFYKYTYEEIYVYDAGEWNLCCNIPDSYPATWTPEDRKFGYSFFGTEQEAYTSMKQESEYLQYFE
ncbi:MAG: hypothetical protein J6D06_01815 [Clostridia bacterium]|nr:hypothetical protein [Clostridia bacterium]